MAGIDIFLWAELVIMPIWWDVPKASHSDDHNKGWLCSKLRSKTIPGAVYDLTQPSACHVLL